MKINADKQSVLPFISAMSSRDTSCVRVLQSRLTAASFASWSFSFNSILTNPARSSNKVTVEITKLTKLSELQRPRLDLETAILLSTPVAAVRQTFFVREVRDNRRQCIVNDEWLKWSRNVGQITQRVTQLLVIERFGVPKRLSSSLFYVKREKSSVANRVCTEIFLYHING